MEQLNTKKNIVLGSKSPRRIELMKMMGFPFEPINLNIAENYPTSLSPIQVAVFLSKKKTSGYSIKENEILVCADTIVYNNTTILEKPKSKHDAIRMLKYISGKRHFVVTGVTFKTQKQVISIYDKSIVYFKKLSTDEINYYIRNQNPLDKAGGYGIQDWIGLIGVTKITGSFYNVMGLPTHLVYQNLIELINE